MARQPGFFVAGIEPGSLDLAPIWLHLERRLVEILHLNAAVVMASSVIAEAVTRITRLEDRTDQLEQKRLAPP